MYNFQWHNSFVRAFKKVTKNNSFLKKKIVITLELLSKDPFNPKLNTHKLHGNLNSLLSSYIDYEYRIIFSISKEQKDTIILIDIGTHDEVY